MISVLCSGDHREMGGAPCSLRVGASRDPLPGFMHVSRSEAENSNSWSSRSRRRLFMRNFDYMIVPAASFRFFCRAVS